MLLYKIVKYFHSRTCILKSRYLGYQAIEDLTKALEFEPKSSDILHERGQLLSVSYLY